MVIGHYMTGIWEHGGIANYIRRVSAAQQKRGHQVLYFDHEDYQSKDAPRQDILCIRNGQELLERCVLEKVDILHTHRLLDIPPNRPFATVRTIHGHEPYCPSGSRYLARQGTPCGRAYNLIGCLRGHLIDRCGSIRLYNIRDVFARHQAEHRTLDQYVVIAVSNFIKQELVRAGYAAERIHVLHTYAPEPKPFVAPPEDSIPHFAFIGRISPQKGIDWLLRAMSHVRRPIHLDIAGDGYYEPEARRLAERLGLADRVTFHGWLEAEAVNTLLSRARALIFPSVWHEPGGAVAGEAMVNGRPVIMSRVGGMPEYVEHERNGLLVEANQIDSLVQAIERLAENWALAKQLGETGSRMAQERFSFNEHVDTLLSLYEQAIDLQKAVSPMSTLAPAG